MFLFLFISFFACPKKEQKKAPTKPTAKFSHKLPVRLKSSYENLQFALLLDPSRTHADDAIRTKIFFIKN
jgi:hypothetical protein